MHLLRSFPLGIEPQNSCQHHRCLQNQNHELAKTKIPFKSQQVYARTHPMKPTQTKPISPLRLGLRSEELPKQHSHQEAPQVHKFKIKTKHKCKCHTGNRQMHCLGVILTSVTVILILILNLSSAQAHNGLLKPISNAPNHHSNSVTLLSNSNAANVNSSFTGSESVKLPMSRLSVAANANNNNNINSNSNNNFNDIKEHATLPRNFVKLGSNNTGPNVRMLTYSANHSPLYNYHSSQANNSEYGGQRYSDSNQNENQKHLYERICIGTSNRMSAQQNKTDHYMIFADRFKNCTYVIGNLEITWLENGTDLSFLESIREISGYLLIGFVHVEKISLPNLQIIRGRDLFKTNNKPDEYAMFLSNNKIKTLELPNLREILAGSVGFHDNPNLCHIKTINWSEILNEPYKSITIYNNVTEPECPPCDASCPHSACWAEGADMCQKFSKLYCPPQCSQGRCFGSLPRDCCHLFCAGGCTGPRQDQCLSCKNFYNDGECIQECPSKQRYNPNKLQYEPNPDGKYAFGSTCVKECPEHLLRDNGACVRACPENKRNSNGECIQCDGPCPKRCQGVDVVHSGNIDQFVNCTVIEGSISILDSSFDGFHEVHSNQHMGKQHEKMHPDRLEAFKTLVELTGYINIQASHPDFKNLSYFRNLEIINGRQTADLFSALSIIRTSLTSLNLRSLRRVRSGRIVIEDNKDLCFVDTINWSHMTTKPGEPVAKPGDLVGKPGENIMVRNNADKFKCRSLDMKCHDQCTSDGCWGPGSDECLSCKNYKLGSQCIEDCGSTQMSGYLSYDSGNRVCKKCHPECKGGCNNEQASDCWQCKNFKDGPNCVPECPQNKHSINGICHDCDKSCTNGCTGNSNRLGEGGCNNCGKTVVNSTSQVAFCIKAEDTCPEGYYQEHIARSAQELFRSSSSGHYCKKCHHRCRSCTGPGVHTSVCECAKYITSEQCEDKCPYDHYTDEKSKRCIECSKECKGCFGPTDADCITCKFYRVYSDSNGPVAAAHIAGKSRNDGPKQEPRFNCTSQCPQNKPHRVSSERILDLYCSEEPGPNEGLENPRVASLWSSSVIFMVIISAALMSCIVIYRCQIEKNKTVKLTMRLSGIDDIEPLNQSNLKPNLAPLISIKETELRKGPILGSGFGGTVYQGLWFPDGQEHQDPRPVAIKVLRDNGQSNMNKEFLDEAYIMASVNHPNLVRLLAVCMTPDQLMLVTNLMPLGCLLDYVRKNKSDIGSKKLLEWCKQIARGMAYLEERRMVHRDLALRNVLLQLNGRALISDFGLAKFLEVDQSEYHSGGGRLPIKWLAPECIRERKFTHKSDVWAFGVTVWELLTFGSKPFEEYDTKDVPMEIEKGARLHQPRNMSAEVYKVLYACWFYNPENRPNFKSLLEHFVNFARDPERYFICGAQGVDYSNQEELTSTPHDVKNSSDDYDSDLESSTEDDSQPRSALPDLVPGSSHSDNRFNEIFNTFELRHHSDTSERSVHNLHTPASTFRRPGVHQRNGFQQLIDENVFTNGPTNMMMSSNTSITAPLDMNNNNMGVKSRNLKGDSCGSVHHTVSTTSLGQKSEPITDLDDYLLPSPCSNEDKFTKFLANQERICKKLPPPPTNSGDPPHSAGLIGITNYEYFYAGNYVNQNGGSHSATNASSGHIPQSLV